jgi:hypothetical protein
MNRIRPFRPIRRLAGTLAALATTLLAAVTAVLAADARARKLHATHSLIPRGVSHVAQKGVNS